MTRCLAALAIAVLVGTAGCEADPETQARQYCGHACACAHGLPSLQRLCVDDCVDALGPIDVPEPCLTCILALDCSDLQGGSDACDFACDSGDPLSSPQETR